MAFKTRKEKSIVDGISNMDTNMAYIYISCIGTSMVIYTHGYTDVLDVNAINTIGYDVFMVQHTSV
jgi:hypothetical protein